MGKRVAPPKAGAASARARAARDKRVDKVIGLMARGEWSGLRSSRDLAQQWGCHIDTVADYAREASTVVRRIVNGDPETIKATILAGIEHIGRVALKTTRIERVGKDEYEERPAPSLDSALRAAELRMKALGLMAPEKLDVTTRTATDLAPADELAQLGELETEIQERKRVLQAQLAETNNEGTLQ